MFNPFQMGMQMPFMPTFLPGQKVERKPLRPAPTEPQATLYIRYRYIKATLAEVMDISKLPWLRLWIYQSYFYGYYGYCSSFYWNIEISL